MIKPVVTQGESTLEEERGSHGGGTRKHLASASLCNGRQCPSSGKGVAQNCILAYTHTARHQVFP